MVLASVIAGVIVLVPAWIVLASSPGFPEAGREEPGLHRPRLSDDDDAAERLNDYCRAGGKPPPWRRGPVGCSPCEPACSPTLTRARCSLVAAAPRRHERTLTP